MHRVIRLTTKDKEYLKTERGLTEEEIAKGLYFSMGSYQELPSGVPTNFPGVDWTGRSLTNRYPGIACVLFNPEGKAIGMQLRVLDDTDEGRYRWVSNQTNRAHLDNGELPLTYIRPKEVTRKHPALVEGTGFKPQIAAHRLGQIVIGAAGGQHRSSPLHLEEYLKTAASHGLDPNTIQLYLDAGDVINDHVMHRLVTTIDLLESWGKTVEIAWWGQTLKTAPDIDELEDLDAIEYIPAAEFEPLKRFRAGLPAIEIDEEPPVVEPSPEEHAKQLDVEKALEQEAEVERLHKEEINRKNYEVLQQRQYKKLKKFTADVIVNQKYFDYEEEQPENTIYAIRSPLGSGKSHWMGEEIAKDPQGWLTLGYRNSLLLQLCERWKFYHLHNDNAFKLVPDQHSNIACCVDSLKHFEPHHFDDKKLILDEVMSIILHILVGGTLKGKRQVICLERFVEALRRAKAVYILDGNLADWAVDYISSLVPEKNVVKIENIYQDPEPLHIDIFVGAVKDQRLKKNNKSPLVRMIQDSCDPEIGSVPAVATDSQIFGETLEKCLLEAGYYGIRVDSVTVSEEWCKKFLEDPDKWIAENKPQYLIYSPTAEGGIDISIKDYFSKQYGFFFGVLGVDSILQMIGRIRDRKVPRTIWTPEFARRDSEMLEYPFVNTIHKKLVKYMLQDAIMSFDGHIDPMAIGQKVGALIERSQDEHFHTRCIIAAIRHYEMRNLRATLIDTLANGNNDVYAFSENSDRQAYEQFKAANEKVKNQKAYEIFNAEDITAKEAAMLEGNFAATWETRCKIFKAKLGQRLPGIKESERWSSDFVRLVLIDERNFISQCERFFLLYHPEVARHLQKDRWQFFFQLEKDSKKAYLGNFRSRYSAVKVLLDAGFLDLLTLEKEWRENDPDIVEFHRKFKASQKKQSALGMRVGYSTPMHFFERVLRSVGLTLKHKQYREYIEGEAKKYRRYRINPDSWNDPDRLAILATLPTRWEQFLAPEDALVVEEPQSTTQPELETAPTPPCSLLETGHPGAVENSEEKVKDLPQNLQDEIQEITSFLAVSINNNLQGFSDILATIQTLTEDVPQLKKWLWDGFGTILKQAIADLSPDDYRWLTS